MHCPIDQTELEVQQGIKVCPKCHGQFFLAGEFESFLNTAKAPAASELKQELKSIVTERPVASGYNKTEGKVCPHCGKLLVKENYDYDSNVFIDHCPSCNAIWIDKDEASKMVAYLAATDKFENMGETLGDDATRDYFYRTATDASQFTHVYPYNPGRTAALGLAGGHPEAQYREYSTLARLVRWPLLYWLARGIIVLTWIAYVVMRTTNSPGIFFFSIAVLVGSYIGMAYMTRWAKKEQVIIREAEKRPFEKGTG